MKTHFMLPLIAMACLTGFLPALAPCYAETGSTPAAAGEDTNTFQLKLEHQGVQRGPWVEETPEQADAAFYDKTQPMRQTLADALAYLKTGDKTPTTMQRVSAFNAEAQLDWNALQPKLDPEDTLHPEYRLMKEAVLQLSSLARYRIAVDKLRRNTLRFSTVRAVKEQQELIKERSLMLRNTLGQLQQLENERNRRVQAILSD